MAIVDINEYASLARDSLNAQALVGKEPRAAYQQVAITAGSVQSSAFGDTTRMIRVHADAACRINIGSNPTAAAGTSMRMAAGQTEYFGVIPGHKLAVITSA
jgi:hypothetical protein